MKKFIFILFVFFIPFFVQAQGGDDWDNRVIALYKNDVEIARESITFIPGFETTGHNDFLAYIDPDLPLNGGTPVSDGITNLNYIRVFEPIRNNYTSDIPEHNEVDYENKWSESITYFDGLGREMQQTMVKASAYGNDIIVPILYDDFGRQKKEYLPYAIAQDGEDGPGGYRPSPEDEIVEYYSTFYDGEDGNYPFSDKKYDGSPLNRVLKQSSPGSDWKLSGTQTMELQYNSNTTGDDVYKFTATDSDQLEKEGRYESNTLFKTTYIDEDDHTTIEFKDLQNRVVRKVVKTGTEDLITQYVYDDFDLLRYVLPPEAFSHLPAGEIEQTYELSQDWIQQYCYYYKYDDRKRMAIKKLPGADEKFLVYNKRDLLILTQDGNLRENDDWLYTKYDVLNRPIITGKYHHNSTETQKSMQQKVNSSEFELYEEYIPGGGYSHVAFPRNPNPDEILTITYYDNYNALELEMFPLDYYFRANELPFYFLENGSYSRKTKGLPTMTKTRVLLHDGLHVAEPWLLSVTYYDKYQHPIQTISDIHIGGATVFSSQINFTGEVEETKEQIITVYGINTIRQKFAYDHAGRIIETQHKINLQDWVVMSKNKYNETGQQTRKQMHQTGNSFLQKINYKYNIRGWLTNINDVNNTGDDLFAMKLDYNQKQTGQQYNGNIASMSWKSKQFPDLKQYDFSYDGANRLKAALYADANKYWTNYSYDKNGNFSRLSRMGELSGTRLFDMIDDLHFGYNGNQLKYINDEQGDNYQENGFTDNNSFLITNEYFYDRNGNLTKDLNKRIDDIDYNLLNLPDHLILLTDGYNYIDYIYSADGKKLRKTTSIDHDFDVGNITDYLGSMVYSYNQPEYIFTPEGRAVPNGTGGYNYEYFLKDHLGNTRVSFSQTGLVLQENNYYPFGMSMGESLSYLFKGTDENQYKYNGKELQDDFGLDWYDYGLRFYDPQISRWHVVDKQSEIYYSYSTYGYSLDNPINAIDPDGQLVLFFNGFRKNQYVLEKVFPVTRLFRKAFRISSTDRHSYWGSFANEYKSRVTVANENALYIDGMGDGPISLAYERYSTGKSLARKMHKAIKRGDLSFGKDETIKIVAHSHGGAPSAGAADFLAKKGYTIERYDGIAIHQPNQFKLKEADKIISANQWGRESDKVSSTGLNYLFGYSRLEKINGIPEENYHILNDVNGSFGGHFIDTFMHELFDFGLNTDLDIVIPQRLPTFEIEP